MRKVCVPNLHKKLWRPVFGLAATETCILGIFLTFFRFFSEPVWHDGECNGYITGAAKDTVCSFKRDFFFVCVKCLAFGPSATIAFHLLHNSDRPPPPPSSFPFSSQETWEKTENIRGLEEEFSLFYSFMHFIFLGGHDRSLSVECHAFMFFLFLFSLELYETQLPLVCLEVARPSFPLQASHCFLSASPLHIRHQSIRLTRWYLPPPPLHPPPTPPTCPGQNAPFI